MDALILCGGFATRLQPISLFLPKPLLPINGRPIIDYIVEDVSSLGVDRIVISTNKKFANQFEYWMSHKQAKSETKMELVVEPTRYHEGKFGAIRGIEYAIKQAGLKNDTIIIAGDNYYDFSLKGVVSHFNEHRKPTICAYDIGSTESATRFGVVKVEGHRVVNFREKPAVPESSLISTGIYVFPAESLSEFSEYLGKQNNPDSPGYFIQSLLENQEVHAVVNKGRWYDIGTLEAYSEFFPSET